MVPKEREVLEKVQEFFKKEFPEIAEDAKEAWVDQEIANLIYLMLTGDFGEEEEVEVVNDRRT